MTAPLTSKVPSLAKAHEIALCHALSAVKHARKQVIKHEGDAAWLRTYGYVIQVLGGILSNQVKFESLGILSKASENPDAFKQVLNTVFGDDKK